MNKNKKHYLIYQTTNLINGKIYIGKHETTNIEDEYFGSGKHLKRAINKYGLENFVKTILFELQNEEEMNLLEKCAVTQEFCDREDTYNINVGGDGGWDYVNSDKSSYGKGSKKRHNAMILANKNRDLQQQASKCKDSFNRIKQNKQQFDEFLLHVSNGVKLHKMNNPDWMVKDNNPMYGKTHTPEAKEKCQNMLKSITQCVEKFGFAILNQKSQKFGMLKIHCQMVGLKDVTLKHNLRRLKIAS